MEEFWLTTFSKVKLDGMGLSYITQLLAEQMLNCILIDTKTNFQSRFITHLLAATDEVSDCKGSI